MIRRFKILCYNIKNMKRIDFASNIKNLKKMILPKEAFAGFSKKLDSVIIVDASSGLKLLNIELGSEVKVSALKTAEFTNEKKDRLLVVTLQDFARENNLQHREVILVPSLKYVSLKRIQIPLVPDTELPDAVKWQFKEGLPFDLSEAIVEFQILEKGIKEDGSKTMDIICVVAEEKEVKEQVLLLKESGFSCVAVNLSVFGYARIIDNYLTGNKEKGNCILHITQNSSYLAIYKGGKLEFFRELPFSINKLKESLTTALVTEKGEVQLTPEEINEALFGIGIPFQSSVYKNKMSSNQILAMLRPELEIASQEISRSLAYYHSRFKGAEVEKIFIGGEGLRIPRLDAFLKNELSLNFLFLPQIDKIKNNTGMETLAVAEHYADVGLAMDYRNNINLLPSQFRTEKIEKAQKVSLRWLAFIAFLILSVAYIFAKIDLGFHKRRLENAQAHLNILSEVKDARARLESLSNFVLQVRDAGMPTGFFLKKISNIAGREIFFNEINLNCESKSGSISGYIKWTQDNPDTILTRFVSDLNNSGYVKNAAIYSVERSSKDGVDINAFQVSLRLP